MPLYEYLCKSCGKRFEALQKFSDAPLETHEECGSGPVERLISPPAFQFKGAGWYVNDYKGASSKPGETKTETKTDAPASGETKTESKPAASESKPSTPAA